MPDEMGSVDVVEVVEIGGDRVTVFKQENDISRTATIVLRGATQNYLDDLERAIDDGVSVVKGLTKDPRLVPGAGAAEMELLKRVLAYGEKTPGLLQHAIKKYAEAFEVVPRTLAETSGLDATEVLSRLYTAHHNSDDGVAGVDIEVHLEEMRLANDRVRKREYWTRKRQGSWMFCQPRVGQSSWRLMRLLLSCRWIRLSCQNPLEVPNLRVRILTGTRTRSHRNNRTIINKCLFRQTL